LPFPFSFSISFNYDPISLLGCHKAAISERHSFVSFAVPVPAFAPWAHVSVKSVFGADSYKIITEFLKADIILAFNNDGLAVGKKRNTAPLQVRPVFKAFGMSGITPTLGTVKRLALPGYTPDK